jgi:hypothetical protein
MLLNGSNKRGQIPSPLTLSQMVELIVEAYG